MLQNAPYRQTILDTLQTAIQDTSPLVRAKAAEALGKLGDETTIPTLLARLTDETPLVRSSIVCSLGELGSETALPALLQALQDKDASTAIPLRNLHFIQQLFSSFKFNFACSKGRVLPLPISSNDCRRCVDFWRITIRCVNVAT